LNPLRGAATPFQNFLCHLRLKLRIGKDVEIGAEHSERVG